MTSARDVVSMAILGGVFSVAAISLALDFLAPNMMATTIVAFSFVVGAGGISILLGIRHSYKNLGCFEPGNIGKGKVVVTETGIPCTDGIVLPAYVYRTPDVVIDGDAAGKKSGFLFIHGFSGTPEDGECYTIALAVAGFVCMTYAQRGQGRRKKAPGRRTEWWRIWQDFAAVLDAFLSLPDVDANHVFVMGHSLGANLAMTKAYDDPRVKAVIALSGMPIQEMLPSSAGRPRPRFASMFKRFFEGSGLTLDQGLASIAPMANVPEHDSRAKDRVFLIHCRDDFFPMVMFMKVKEWFDVPDEHCLMLDHGGHKAEGQSAIIVAQLISWLAALK